MKRYVYINDDELSHDLFCDNHTSNRKYTALNFISKNLPIWMQLLLLMAVLLRLHYRKTFTELAIMSRTAICYRMTPSQKAQNLKSCDFRTLAFSDGGNDVTMIQQADISVGISEFKFLKRLILVHGRHSYYSTAFLSITTHSISPYSYVSSKSCVFTTSLYSSVSLMAYNVLYISIPVLFSVPDKDLSDESVMEHPQILFYCQAGRGCTCYYMPKFNMVLLLQLLGAFSINIIVKN